MIDLVDFEEDRQRHVVANQFKVGLVEQVNNVRLLARKKVVQADDIVPLSHQPLTQMRAEKTSSSGHQNAIDRPHCSFLSNVRPSSCELSRQHNLFQVS